MSVVEHDSVSAWPDTAGDLPFALQRPRLRPVATPRPEDTRLLAHYAEQPVETLAADEAVGVVGGHVALNPIYAPVITALEELGSPELRGRAIRRDRLLLSDGVTFGGQPDQPRAPFPIDLMPRLLPVEEWTVLRRGLEQRAAALTAFLEDIYDQQHIVRDGVLPAGLAERAPGWDDAARAERMGATPRPPRATVMGTDMLRARDGRWLVLEDNLRVPSGLGYALEARRTMATVLPELTVGSARQTVSVSPSLLKSALQAAVPCPIDREPAIAVLSPGPSDSAWFEHRMLASAMKVPLVLPRDLMMVGDRIAIARADGPRRIDVLYRRFNDDDLAGAVSASGEPLLPMLLHAVRHGCLWLGNALGNGVGDDKAIYAFVPKMISYYLGEEPLLDNVPTMLLSDEDSRAHALSRLAELVVKPVDGMGGAGVVIGPAAGQQELAELRARIEAHPERYVAQELVDFTTHPTFISHRLEPRRVDLRVFTVCSPEPVVLPAPLTRVALTPGSMIVNSSRGGGAKDTWIVRS